MGRSVEGSWLGPWRCLLVGDHLNCERLDMVVKKLKSDLKSRFKFEVHESLLKAVVGGAQSLAESEVCVSQLLSYKGYLGRGGCCGEDIFGSVASCDATGSIYGLPYQLILEAVGDIVEESTDREPVVLVLDANVQVCFGWVCCPLYYILEFFLCHYITLEILIGLKSSYCPFDLDHMSCYSRRYLTSVLLLLLARSYSFSFMDFYSVKLFLINYDPLI
eukprot:TRINITY_DN18757_c0_g1_i1.p1 TRINITY_DN18757_c0_g1~~TRINITY_DN18757_c0_g1_i1.p1  ORF type:complete len:219 (+),score=20.18 TRINITY_DN18757_c0_g1_i1:341-997(+)